MIESAEGVSNDIRQPNGQVTQIDYPYAMKWLKRAEEDAIEAQASRSHLHALFWTQQSVEKSVKGLMFLKGKEYNNVIEIRHQSLKGDLRLVHEVVNDSNLGRFVDRFTGQDSKRQLSKMQNMLGNLSPEDSEELRLMPVGIVDAYRAIVGNIEKSRKMSLTPATVTRIRKQLWSDRSPRAQLEALHDFARQSANPVASEFLDFMLNTYNVCEHYLGVSGIASNPELQNDLFEEVFAFHLRNEAQVRLYLLAAITFPHEASVRYPARPGSPSDPKEAARSTKRDSFGIEHYSNQIGAFRRVRALAKDAERVAKALQVQCPMIDNLQQLPPCPECQTAARTGP